MSCLVTPPAAHVLPSTSSLTWRRAGSLASSHQAWLTWSPDSVLGVISSGIRCARTFCEHLTALYAVECSKYQTVSVCPPSPGSDGRRKSHVDARFRTHLGLTGDRPNLRAGVAGGRACQGILFPHRP